MAITKQQTITNLQILINEIELLINNSISGNIIQWEGFLRWKSACQDSLAIVFGNQSQIYLNFQQVNYLPPPALALTGNAEILFFVTAMKSAKEVLEGSLFVVNAWWQDTAVEEPIKVLPFISYGGRKGKNIGYKIKDLFTALNIQVLIAEDLPNIGLSLDQKIELLMSISNVAIVIMTAEDIVNNKLVGIRQNVIHELATLKHLGNISNRIICLKEKDAVLPSNIKNLAYSSLNNSNLESVYICILKELKAFGFYL